MGKKTVSALLVSFCLLGGCIDSHRDGAVLTSHTVTLTGWVPYPSERVRLYAYQNNTWPLTAPTLPPTYPVSPPAVQNGWSAIGSTLSGTTPFLFLDQEWYQWSVQVTIRNWAPQDTSYPILDRNGVPTGGTIGRGRLAYVSGYMDGNDDGVFGPYEEALSIFYAVNSSDYDGDGADCRDYSPQSLDPDCNSQARGWTPLRVTVSCGAYGQPDCVGSQFHDIWEYPNGSGTFIYSKECNPGLLSSNGLGAGGTCY